MLFSLISLTLTYYPPPNSAADGSMDLPTPFSHLHRSLLAATAPQPSHASPALIGPHINSLRTSVAVIAGVLAAMFSVTLVLLVYSKHCKRHVGADDSADVGLVTVFPASSTSRRRSGVDRAVIEGLPAFRFGSLIGQKDGLECAVCLNRYGPDDALRLLPKCRHGFHVDCVDTWLDAHSSCPLCRARVDPGDVAIAIEPDRPVEMGTRKSKKVGEGFGKPRWVSGRHSSAGEKSTGLLPRFAADRSEPRDPRERRSVDRIGHRIVVTGGGDAAADQRWSKLRPSDFLLLRAEMIVASTRSSSTSRGSCSSAVVEM